MKVLRKYWYIFLALAFFALVGVVLFFRKKNNAQVLVEKPSNDVLSQSRTGNAEIKVNRIIPNTYIVSGTIEYEGGSKSFSASQATYVENVAIRNGYSYTIKSEGINSDSTDIQVFYNGKMLDWVSVDWQENKFAHIPVR